MKIKTVMITIIIIALFSVQIVAAVQTKSPTEIGNDRIDKGAPSSGPTAIGMERIETNKSPMDPATICVALGFGATILAIRRRQKQ